MSPDQLRPPASIVVVSPDAGRTGTPRLLLSWLRWLSQHAETSVSLVLGAGGPLLDDLMAVADVRVVEQGRIGSARGTAGLALRELGQTGTADRVTRLAWRNALRRRQPPEVLVLNGASSLRVLDDRLPWHRPRLVVGHLHEMATGIERSLSGADPTALLRQLDAVIVVSDAVRAEVIARGVDPTRVFVHPGWVPDDSGVASSAGASTSQTRRRRQNLGIPDGVPVVGGCGTLGWRKGTDLFLAVAQLVRAERPAHFIWMGGPHRPVDARHTNADIATRGLTGTVHLIGEQPNPGPWFSLFDVLALTSREDPYPLVALEAGAAGIPVAAFASGGVAELLDEAGPRGSLLAEPLDIVGLAAAICGLLDDPMARARAGRALADVVHRRHTVGVAAPALWSRLCRLTAQAGATGAPPPG